MPTISLLRSLRVRRLAAATLLPFLLLGLLVPAAPAALGQAPWQMPPGFVRETIVDGLRLPTAFAAAPDGRIFFAEKRGRVRVMADGVLLKEPFIDLTGEVNAAADRGMTGIAVHPDWPDTPYLYVAYVYEPEEAKERNEMGARVSRLVRFTADANDLNKVEEGSGVVLLGTNSTFANIGNPDEGDQPPFSCLTPEGGPVQDCLPAESTAHTIDMLRFGSDGALYVGNGDGSTNTKINARAVDPNSLAGKVLRINPYTGEGYRNNPYYDGDLNSNASKVYVLGMRNPFRFTFSPKTGNIVVGEVGNFTWEEVNVGTAGDNFGWPCYEGQDEASEDPACAPLFDGSVAVTHAWHTYPHNERQGAIIGGDFYTGNKYPAKYKGVYFYADFNGGLIQTLTIKNNETEVAEFGSNVFGPVQLSMGPNGNLWLLSVADGALYELVYGADLNSAPDVIVGADPASGRPPLTVTFSGSKSVDPDGDKITFLWEFGDGATSTKANPSHTYEEAGSYSAKLAVADDNNAIGYATVEIEVGEDVAETSVVPDDAPVGEETTDLGSGAITREYWNGVGGKTIADLTGSDAYPDGPTGSEEIAVLDTDRGFGGDYGTRIRGYLHPPRTGSYKFYIAADDQGQLWLSTDEDPANKALVAYVDEWTGYQQWDKYLSQASVTLKLTAGKRYYIEILHKQADNKDNLSVAWMPPGGAREVIDGKYLSPIGE